MDRALGLASIAVGLLATVVLAVAVSADYWLYTDEPIDTGMVPQLAPTTDSVPGDTHDADDESLSSVVVMVTTNSGLWRVCVYPKVDYSAGRSNIRSAKPKIYTVSQKRDPNIIDCNF